MSALKKLSHRNWGVIRDLWIDHLPQMDIHSEYLEPTLWQLPKINYGELKSDGTSEFPYIDGVREAIFREAILLSRKFIYCAQSLPTLSSSGKTTWSAIGAYEASFYGAKALCYFLGFAHHSRDSKIYIDAFYETERKIGKEKIKEYTTLRAHKLDDRLTHATLWDLTKRLINTTVFSGELLELQIQIKLTDWEDFSSLRNRVFYDGGFWPLATDLAACDLVVPRQNQQIFNASLLQSREAVPFGDEYFSLARLLRCLITGMLQSIADVAPAINAEVQAFESLSQAA